MKALVWFTDNLRVADHPLLDNACKEFQEVEAVFCFDPSLLKANKKGLVKMGPYRAKFLIESVLELQKSLEELHIPLHILVGDPANEIAQLVNSKEYTTLFTQKLWHSEEVARNMTLYKALPKQVDVVEKYDQFLLDPNQWPFELDTLPNVFTVFRKKVEKNLMVPSPLAVPSPLVKSVANKTPQRPGQLLIEAATPQAFIAPEWKEISEQYLSLITDRRSAFPFKGGEKQALARLQSYFWDTDHVAVYKKTRNGLLGTEYSTKFSAWLANGSISARTIYAALKKYEQQRSKNESTYWVFFELLWREFFKCVGLKHGNDIFKNGGIINKDFAQGNDLRKLQKWQEGKTQDAFVNANMIELLKTGWMSNRGRQNVASFWSKNWGQDWRVGAAYFETMLIDYDVDCNWSNWMYASGVGNDPRDRVFNTQRQASMYDPTGSFQRHWLQEDLF